MLTITNSAKTKIIDLLIEENNPDVFLRVFIQGGGCSGMQYGFSFDYDLNDDDIGIELDQFRVIVDSVSMQYLEGAVVDYKEDLMESRFVINNPNAVTSCGCGSSFSTV